MARLFSFRTSRFRVSLLVGVIVVALANASWAASFATSDGFDGIGFDGATLGPVDRVLGPSTVFVDANDPTGPGTTDVQIDGSLDLCILLEGSRRCDLTGQDPAEEPFVGTAGPISFLVTLTVSAVNNPDIDTSGFTLVLRDLAENVDSPDFGCPNDDCPDYDRSHVTIDGTYERIHARRFDMRRNQGINGFDPFQVLEHEVGNNSGDIRYYRGWDVALGDSVTFRFDLEEGTVLYDLPHFEFSAIPVPEPGTGVLFALGLAGLSVGRGRRA